MESPYKHAADSPSRQLLWELGRLQVSEQARFYEKLDRDAEDQECIHRQALAAAAAEHERIRRGAEIEREKLEAQLQLEQERRKQNELREIQRVRREKAEQEIAFQKQQIEEARAAEAAEREAATRRRAQEIELAATKAAAAERARAETQRRNAEKSKQEAEEQDRAQKDAEAQATALAKAREAVLASQQKQAEQRSASQALNSNPTAISGAQRVGSSHRRANETKEAEHQRYLAIHRKLKELRAFMNDQRKNNPKLKEIMGDGRRTIRKCVGQLTGEKGANKAPLQQIVTVLKNSLQFTHPQANVPDFLFSPPKNVSNPSGPALLLYLLNILAKALISQYIGEVAISPKAADAIGVIGTSVYAQNEFRWQDSSLIDLLIAKFHVVCPVLFGIYGDEKTSQGRRRSGWWTDENGNLIPEQRHTERMTGLGAGFSSIALRNFDKSKLSNPFPPYHFWQAVANIVNVPPDLVTSTQLVVLKFLIEGNEQRIFDFWGNNGVALLQLALIEFPQRVAIRDSVAAKALTLMPDLLRTEKKLYL